VRSCGLQGPDRWLHRVSLEGGDLVGLASEPVGRGDCEWILLDGFGGVALHLTVFGGDLGVSPSSNGNTPRCTTNLPVRMDLVPGGCELPSFRGAGAESAETGSSRSNDCAALLHGCWLASIPPDHVSMAADNHILWVLRAAVQGRPSRSAFRHATTPKGKPPRRAFRHATSQTGQRPQPSDAQTGPTAPKRRKEALPHLTSKR